MFNKFITASVLLISIVLGKGKIAQAEHLSLIRDTGNSRSGFFCFLRTLNDELYFTESKRLEAQGNVIYPRYETQLWKYKNNQFTKITNSSIKSDQHQFGFYPSEVVTHDKSVYFVAHSNEYGRELWKYDGNKLWLYRT